jgi:hypothetical protein
MKLAKAMSVVVGGSIGRPGKQWNARYHLRIVIGG